MTARFYYGQADYIAQLNAMDASWAAAVEATVISAEDVPMSALDLGGESVLDRMLTIQAAQAAGVIGFTTKALMDAELDYDANTLALVTNDSTPANNTTYIKVGATGTGSWLVSATSALQAYIDSVLTEEVLTDLTGLAAYAAAAAASAAAAAVSASAAATSASGASTSASAASTSASGASTSASGASTSASAASGSATAAAGSATAAAASAVTAAAVVAAFYSTVGVFTKNQSITPVTLTDGANIAVNASLSNNFKVVLGDDRTLDNPTNLTDGMILNFRIKQDGTGGRVLSFGDKYYFPGGVALLSTDGDAIDIMSCYYDSTTGKLYCSLSLSFGAPA